MSLVNVHIAHDRALIATDTLSGLMACGPQMDVGELHMTKCALLPHVNVAMAHRGDAMFATMAFSALTLAAHRDFDGIAEIMPDLLASLVPQAMAARKQIIGVEAFPGAEIILVGWSPTLGRFEGVRWVRWPQDKAFTASRIGKALMLPDAEWAQTPDPPDTSAKMERIARDQVAYVRREHHGLPCGGRLMLTELTRDAITIRQIADLELPSAGVS